MDIKRTNRAIGSKPVAIRKTIESAERIMRVLSDVKHRTMWPPSSIAAGNRLSIVTNIPTHPAKAIGCKEIATTSPGLGVGTDPGGGKRLIINRNSRGTGRVGEFSGIRV